MAHDVKTSTYRAYGINIRSAVQLPELAKTESLPDVRIRYGKVADSSLLESLVANGEVFERPGFRIVVTPGAIAVRWDLVGTFLIRQGAEVVIDPEPSVLEEDLQPFLTGPVLSVLLHQRGFLVLHSSAVVIGTSAVAFLGAKGDGKSTLAAHLQVRGHRLIADDIVPVNLENSDPSVVAGFPRIKLYNDSIAAVGEEPSNFPLIHRFVEKRSFQYSDSVSAEPIPLQSVFILSDSEEVSLEELGHAAAFIEITRHSYVNRYLKALNDESKHFQQCHQLMKRIPVWKLNRPRDFSTMNEVCELLEDNVRKRSLAAQAFADQIS
jgi:hypothetical protein